MRLSLFAAAALLTLTACSGGIDNVDDYRAAMASFDNHRKSAMGALQESRRRGDPMQLRGGLEAVMPSAKRMVSAVNGVKVGESLQPAHDQLVQAVTSFHGELDALLNVVMGQPLVKSKTKIENIIKDFDSGLESWKQAL